MGSQGCLSLIPGSYRGEGPDLREGPESPPLRSGGVRSMDREEGPYLIQPFAPRTWYPSMAPCCL